MQQGTGVILYLNLVDLDNLKYDGEPIKLVNSVIPSKSDVAVYLRLYQATTPLTPCIKVWDNELIPSALDLITVKFAGSGYKLNYYIDGKGNYADVGVASGS